jgi:hypothetical protein
LRNFARQLDRICRQLGQQGLDEDAPALLMTAKGKLPVKYVLRSWKRSRMRVTKVPPSGRPISERHLASTFAFEKMQTAARKQLRHPELVRYSFLEDRMPSDPNRSLVGEATTSEADRENRPQLGRSVRPHRPSDDRFSGRIRRFRARSHRLEVRRGNGPLTVYSVTCNTGRVNAHASRHAMLA